MVYFIKSLSIVEVYDISLVTSIYASKDLIVVLQKLCEAASSFTKAVMITTILLRITLSNTLIWCDVKEIGRWLAGSVLYPFLYTGAKNCVLRLDEIKAVSMDHFQSRVSGVLMECLQYLRILAGMQMSSCDVAAYASNSSMALMMSSLSKSILGYCVGLLG